LVDTPIGSRRTITKKLVVCIQYTPSIFRILVIVRVRRQSIIDAIAKTLMVKDGGFQMHRDRRLVTFGSLKWWSNIMSTEKSVAGSLGSTGRATDQRKSGQKEGSTTGDLK
jgi:hypothetical protein